MSKYDILKTPPKALTFDIFGTVVDWRTTVTKRLIQEASQKTSHPDLTPALKDRLSRLSDKDWGTFAQQWRNTYKTFVVSFQPGTTEWRDVDTHHHLSLISLLQKWNLSGLYTDEEIKDLSLIWHKLDPWSDSSRGIHALGKMFTTSTLSNGNQSLLQDLQKHGNLGFQILQSSADFKAYKPHPSVYRNAAKGLGCETSEVAMVASHLGDLKAAKSTGMRTVYVERKGEEDWVRDGEDWKEARDWVDLWVEVVEDGILEVARRFGISESLNE